MGTQESPFSQVSPKFYDTSFSAVTKIECALAKTINQLVKFLYCFHTSSSSINLNTPSSYIITSNMDVCVLPHVALRIYSCYKCPYVLVSVIEGMLNGNRTLKVMNLYGCAITDQTAKYILSGLTKNTSHVTLDMGSSKLSGSCAVSLLQQTNTTSSITVGVLRFRKVKVDSGTMWCAVDNIGDANSGNCGEFFRELNEGLRSIVV